LIPHQRWQFSHYRRVPRYRLILYSVQLPGIPGIPAWGTWSSHVTWTDGIIHDGDHNMFLYSDANGCGLRTRIAQDDL